MSREWNLIGVPSSAGAHTPGVEKAPAALRDAGLIERLTEAGAHVADHGDVPGFRWRPDPEHPSGQHPQEVARVAADVAGVVAEIAASRTGTALPLVVGGDCTITIGVVAGLTRAGRAPALLYFDGGPDLYTPRSRPNGNLDAMGLAHMLGIDGHDPVVAGPDAPLLTPDRIVSYGDGLPEHGDLELGLLRAHGILRISALDVHRDLALAAERARRAVEAAAPEFVIHLDVDVLAFLEGPFADVPEPDGLTRAELYASLAVFLASPRVAGLVLTEINPDHVPEPADLAAFVAELAPVLAG